MERQPIGFDSEAARVTKCANQDLDDIFGMLFGFDSQQTAIDSVIRYKERLSRLIERLPELQEKYGPVFTRINLTENYVNPSNQTNALSTIEPAEIDEHNDDNKTGTRTVAFPLFTKDGIYILSHTFPLKFETYETIKGFGPWKRKVQGSQEPEWVIDNTSYYKSLESTLRSVKFDGVKGLTQKMAIIGKRITGELNELCFQYSSFIERSAYVSHIHGKIDLFDSGSPDALFLYTLINASLRESRLFGRRFLEDQGRRAESAMTAFNTVDKYIPVSAQDES